MDELPVPDREASRRVGALAYAVLYRTLAALLAVGIGAVAESNFYPGRSEKELRPLLALARAVQVHCTTVAELRRRRYAARAAGGVRHPGHFDDIVLRDWSAESPEDPLNLDVPTLSVNTAKGYRPPLADIVGFVLAST